MSIAKKVAICGIGAALYCVLSMFVKVPLIGNISLDLGYIALAMFCAELGPIAMIVGAVGCSAESILFSAYGFSIGWFVANLFIGAFCGIAYKELKHMGYKIVVTVVNVAMGMALKTVIECSLYGIPFMVKLPKSTVAWATDSIMMVIGLVVYEKYIKHRIKRA